MSDIDLSNDPKAMDAASAEARYSVQCASVSLSESWLRPIKNYDGVDVSRFLFKIKIDVEGIRAFANLHVQVAAYSGSPETPGCELNFTLLGVFRSDGNLPPEALGEFARYYSLPIMWPYAREYTSDILRRANLVVDELPIINPQVVTEKLIEAGLIEVTVCED